jgi:hypothetical protein
VYPGQRDNAFDIFVPRLPEVKTISSTTTEINTFPVTLELLTIDKTPSGQIKVRNNLIKKLDPKDPTSLFTVIDTIEANKDISRNCHEIAHDIGHKAYELYGFSGSLNFTDSTRLNHPSISDICSGGYIHGVLEEAAIDDVNFKESVSTVCSTVSKKDSASCFHGVGHALMFSYGRDVESSLAACRDAGSLDKASRCFEGVWMELFWGVLSSGTPTRLGFDTENPLAPCVATQSDAKPACFLYSSFGYLRKHKKNYTGAITLCTKSKLNENDTNFCLKGVGITMNSNFKAHNLERSEVFMEGKTLPQKKAFYQGVFGYANLTGVAESEIRNTCDSFTNDTAICNSVVEKIYSVQ